jgi:flavin reductase (DIM6/NTAB) family NADH-FMN oxidoreductase RutF
MPPEDKRTYDVAELEPIDAYKLGSGLTAPRPIGWIGSISEDGVHNLAPYSFFNMVATYPPTFVVAPQLGGRKDTLANLEATRVFTVNIVSEDTVEAMNASSGTYPADVDEFDECGLTAVGADTNEAPMVAEAVANFECRVVDMIPVGKANNELPGTGMLVIGEAQRIHVAKRVSDDNFHIDPHELRAVGRHAGGWYSRTADSMFQIDRPS